MPEYDAFGRPVGEDTLAEQGWRTGFGDSRTEATGATPVPVDPGVTPPSPRPQAPASVFSAGETTSPPRAPRAPSLGGRRRRNPLRVLVGWIVALAVLGVLGSIAFSVVGTVSSTVDSARDTFKGIGDAVEGTGASPFPGSDAEDTAPADGPSLLTVTGMTRGKAALRRAAPGRIRTFRIEAARIDLQAVKGARTRIAQYQRGAQAARVIATVSSGSAVSTMAYRELDPRAPRRLVAAGARRLGKSPARINYLVASRGFGDGISWTAFWRDGDYARGDARGRLTDVYRG